MKYVMSQPGLLNWSKVFILVGGPDWPTSVLCGILDLPHLIVPTYLTGSFTYLASLPDDYYPQAPTWATICAAATAVVQLGSMVLAASALSALEVDDDELNRLVPLDAQVHEEDQLSQLRQETFDAATEWKKLPWPLQLAVGLSVVLYTVAYHLWLFWDEQCFVEYQLSYTIQEHLDGNVLNFVLPLGWWSMGLALLAGLLQGFVFGVWAPRRVVSAQQQQQHRDDAEAPPSYQAPTLPENTSNTITTTNNETATDA
eukprot:CAMPEP_0178923206 /NCGR_PEP_ID=MMETSP0786-20121207/16588_1 /TAXON_ID=186022 /ORGANISM="Thalassionema frauenfeldii, Strain CCMP 1798" /LENGTH=256 /DNA_ID=CAMNT_0020597671 /DNA_START=333 /DNA_END=1099 /DNA_ORIENTATION=+